MFPCQIYNLRLLYYLLQSLQFTCSSIAYIWAINSVPRQLDSPSVWLKCSVVGFCVRQVPASGSKETLLFFFFFFFFIYGTKTLATAATFQPKCPEMKKGCVLRTMGPQGQPMFPVCSFVPLFYMCTGLHWIESLLLAWPACFAMITAYHVLELRGALVYDKRRDYSEKK